MDKRKNQLKMIMETKLAGLEVVLNLYDNQFYEADCYIRGTNLVAKYNYRNGDKTEYTYYTQNAN